MNLLVIGVLIFLGGFLTGGFATLVIIRIDMMAELRRQKNAH